MQTNTPATYARCNLHNYRQMGLTPSSPSISGLDYHRLPAGVSEKGEDQSLPRLPPLPLLAHVKHSHADDDPAVASETEPESPWALLRRTSDADDDDEGGLVREVFHLPTPLLSWTTVQTPVIPAGGAQPEDDTHSKRRRCQKWCRWLARFLMMPPSICRWLPGYTKQQLWGDMLGGLTVAVMVIPQGMSYAVLAELPPVYGLFCALAGPLIYSLLGTSRHLSIGPVALVSLSLPRVYSLLYPSLLSLPDDEAASLRIQAALSITFVSGLVLATLGLLRLGLMAHFIPPAVMVGFTNAAALAIGISQTKEILGLRNVPRFDYTWQSCWYVLTHLNEGQAASAGIGVACILFLLGAKYFKTRLVDRAPPPTTGRERRRRGVIKILHPFLNLFLVILTSLVARLLVSQGVEIVIVKHVAAGLPKPAVPRLELLWTIVGHSLSIVLVAFMEAYAIAKKYALQDGYPLNVNRELLALGAANIGGSFFASYPVSGSFSRSAVSYSAGTQTQLANAMGALCVMVVLLFLAQFFYYLPRATLGAIIEVALLNLLDLKSLKQEYRRSRLDFVVALVTFCVTLAFDTELGLLAGLSASALLLYWMPRGGALITRVLLRPILRRRGKCDVCVVDLARLASLPLRVQVRLEDYLRYERRARGANPYMLLILDGQGVVARDKGVDGGNVGGRKNDWKAKGGREEAHIQIVVRRAMDAAVGAGLPLAMVTLVGLSFSSSCSHSNSSTSSLLLSAKQEELAQAVLERAHSVSLVAAYGEDVMAEFTNNRE